MRGPTTATVASTTIYENPVGTDGFEFVEYSAPDGTQLQRLFESLGFTPIAKHKSKHILLYRQGDINFIINMEPGSFALSFTAKHGPCACTMGLRVKNVDKAMNLLLQRGAEPYTGNNTTFDLPIIKGIGNSLIYLTDRYGENSIYRDDFEPLSSKPCTGVGLTYLDHLTHNVYKGGLDKWAGFYEKLFNFREVRFFDIKGQQTGLLSRAMASPCGKIRIPINEPTDDKSQIQEYLDEYKGEGIQHIAMGTDNIYESVEALRSAGISFMTILDTYYDLLDKRLPSHNEDIERLQKNRILVDGDMNAPGKPKLLQIFTNTVIGPIFFEIIQRKGHDGFGEGNFGALFESIELDQMQRGVL